MSRGGLGFKLDRGASQWGGLERGGRGKGKRVDEQERGRRKGRGQSASLSTCPD